MTGNLLILPGSNPELRDWTEAVAEEIGSLFRGSTIHEYMSWADPSASLSFREELGRLRSLPLLQEPLFVFAKSFGSVLALSAENSGLLTPAKQFFVGFPLEECRQNGYPIEKHFRGLKVPTLFLQNHADPFGSAEDLQLVLEANLSSPYELLTFGRHDHHYPDIGALRTAIEAFLA
jgi:predicted alpha/beta-hydrolase family hydrolase